MSNAVADGFLGKNPCSKKLAPPMGESKTYVITTEQVWQLHDEMPDHLQVAVLLGAFCGLRVAEVAGLRVADVDFMRCVVKVKQQWGDQPLKSDDSKADIPIPRDLANMLNASVQKYPSEFMVTAGHGTERCGPWLIQRAIRRVKDQIEGVPEEFSFHDLRHHYASLLISSGENVKTVQKRMRHASARTTLDIYAHLWPGEDESTRTAVGAAIMQRSAQRDRAQ